MPRVYTCPKGHQWQAADSQPSNQSGICINCPSCGQAGQPVDANSTPSPGGETGPYATKLLPQAAPADEYLTRPPLPVIVDEWRTRAPLATPVRPRAIASNGIAVFRVQ